MLNYHFNLVQMFPLIQKLIIHLRNEQNFIQLSHLSS